MVISSEIRESYIVLVSTESANLEEEPTASSLTLLSYTSDELAKLQSQDRVLSRIKYWCSTGNRPSLYALKRQPDHVRKILRYCDTLQETGGVLYRRNRGEFGDRFSSLSAYEMQCWRVSTIWRDTRATSGHSL